MAKKKRNRPESTARPAATPRPVAGADARNRPMEAGASAIVALFALMMLLAPALGVPTEEMLQDTLKSIVVSFIALGAGLLMFWEQRERTQPLRWHAVMVLPLLLMAYALGSMVWSHTYLGGVEAIRWFLFALLLWLGMNSLSRDSFAWLAWGIHSGAVIASLWAALQFWVDFKLFPQGPNPASTFVNRNFFAEFVVCTLPFSALLLARARQSSQTALLAASTGLVITTILMTGTRSALIAMWLQLLVVAPLVGWRCRGHPAFPAWTGRAQVLAAGVLLLTVVVLGMIPTGNAKIADEGRGTFALERGIRRTGSISPDDASLGIRMIMWKATVRVIEARPLSGVGAGAWESEIPLYQAEGAQLETDYYVHNEFLQLLAEYGAVGWVFLVLLTAWLVAGAWRTFRARTPEEQAEVPLRAIVLCSLLTLLIVSNVGFPWRMAATGALFALCLGALAASDARLGYGGRWGATPLPWKPVYSRSLAGFMVACLALASYITQQAAQSEQKIVRATKLALTISASGSFNSPRWNQTKTEMLELIKEGVEINRHYRKITPMVADELARWGDWKNATWIWESVLSSRPYVVAIITNAARGHAVMGDTPMALELLERAKKVQPNAPAVRSLEVVLLARAGNESAALAAGREAIDRKLYDLDLSNTTYSLAARAGDYALAERAMELRMVNLPASRIAGLLELGAMYAGPAKDPDKAFNAFRKAVELVPVADREGFLQRIPMPYRAQLAQTSANSR